MPNVKKFAMAYAAFLAMTALTAIVVRPILAKSGVPLLTRI